MATDYDPVAFPSAAGVLYGLLHNRLYVGEIAYRGKVYPGQHEAIVDRALWERAQVLLVANRTEHKVGSRGKHPSLLAGPLYDDRGERMTPTYAVKRSKR